MSDIERSRGSRPSRKQREQRAFRLLMAGGTFGVLGVVGLVLAIVTSFGAGLPILALVIAAIWIWVFRGTVSGGTSDRRAGAACGAEARDAGDQAERADDQRDDREPV